MKKMIKVLAAFRDMGANRLELLVEGVKLLSATYRNDWYNTRHQSNRWDQQFQFQSDQRALSDQERLTTDPSAQSGL